MFIKKVRLGFPTASSSTHSIVIHPNIKKYNNYFGEEFGWDNFVVSSAKTKHNYFAYIFRDNLAKTIGLDAANYIVGELFGVSGQGYIDGNSVFSFPAKRTGKGIDMDFFKEFYAFLMQENVGIVGGNDNTVNRFEIPEAKEFLDLCRFANLGQLVCRKDPTGYWVLYNPENGTKLRLSFIDKPISYSLLPELIDLKITDYCPNQCSFCYQGSSRAGKHARLDHHLAYEIAASGAIEVVIGGGEPTFNPGLLEFVEYLRAYNIIVSLTTVSTHFLKPENVENFVRIGVTVHDRIGLYSINALPIEVRQKVSLHVIDGVTSEKFLRQVFEFCYNNFIPVVVLGFKKPKRDFVRVQTNALQVIKEYIAANKCPIVSVDTAFAKEYDLSEIGISNLLYDNTENFSMYIDLVEKTASSSSYSEDTIPVELKHDSFIDAYKKIRGVLE